jgi:hypothetical protein
MSRRKSSRRSRLRSKHNTTGTRRRPAESESFRSKRPSGGGGKNESSGRVIRERNTPRESLEAGRGPEKDTHGISPRTASETPSTTRQRKGPVDLEAETTRGTGTRPSMTPRRNGSLEAQVRDDGDKSRLATGKRQETTNGSEAIATNRIGTIADMTESAIQGSETGSGKEETATSFRNTTNRTQDRIWKAKQLSTQDRTLSLVQLSTQGQTSTGPSRSRSGRAHLQSHHIGTVTRNEPIPKFLIPAKCQPGSNFVMSSKKTRAKSLLRTLSTTSEQSQKTKRAVGQQPSPTNRSPTQSNSSRPCSKTN